MLAGPGLDEPGRRITHLTHHLDLAPTLLALAGLEAPPSFRGDRLTREPARAYADQGPWLAVHAGDRKLVLNRDTGTAEVYDLADSLDQTPLQETQTELRLLDETRRYQALVPPDGVSPGEAEAKAEWSQEESLQLEALGYGR